jgi:hypothetical protein
MVAKKNDLPSKGQVMQHKLLSPATISTELVAATLLEISYYLIELCFIFNSDVGSRTISSPAIVTVVLVLNHEGIADPIEGFGMKSFYVPMRVLQCLGRRNFCCTIIADQG